MSSSVGHKAPSKRTQTGDNGLIRKTRGMTGSLQAKAAAATGTSSTTGEKDQRTTRSATRPQVARLKLKFSDTGEVTNRSRRGGGRGGHGASGPGSYTSFLGDYTRDADSDPDEPIVFEEQFILRVPHRVAQGDSNVKGIKTMLDEKKQVTNAWFTFKDPRRAVFHHGGQEYGAKLVDLPCIIEAQKTLDRKRLFKVADITQMLVVDPEPVSESSNAQDSLHDDNYLWPHGLTPPLRHVRERRWRKKRSGDAVRAQVDQLLIKDKEARYSEFDFIDPVVSERPGQSSRPSHDGYADDVPWSPRESHGALAGEPGEEPLDEEGDGVDDEGDELALDDRTDLGSAEGDMDMDLEAALNHANQNDRATDDEDDADEEDEDDEVEEEEEEEEEEEDEHLTDLRAQHRLLDSEVSALQAMVEKKTTEMTHVSAMIRMRIQRDVHKYQADLAVKRKARDENGRRIQEVLEAKAAEKREQQSRGSGPDDGGGGGAGRGEQEGEAGDEYDGLFGEDDEEDEDGRSGSEDHDGQDGDQGEQDSDQDEWDQIFANDETPTAAKGQGDDSQHEQSLPPPSLEMELDPALMGGGGSGGDAETEPEDESAEGDSEEEDDEDDQSVAVAPSVPITLAAPPAPANTGGWGYVESDEDDDDDD